MLVKDLITQLELLRANSLKLLPELGEPELMIDIFRLDGAQWRYLGISGDIRITNTTDGVYPVLTAIEE